MALSTLLAKFEPVLPTSWPTAVRDDPYVARTHAIRAMAMLTRRYPEVKQQRNLDEFPMAYNREDVALQVQMRWEVQQREVAGLVNLFDKSENLRLYSRSQFEYAVNNNNIAPSSCSASLPKGERGKLLRVPRYQPAITCQVNVSTNNGPTREGSLLYNRRPLMLNSIRVRPRPGSQSRFVHVRECHPDVREQIAGSNLSLRIASEDEEDKTIRLVALQSATALEETLETVSEVDVFQKGEPFPDNKADISLARKEGLEPSVTRKNEILSDNKVETSVSRREMVPESPRMPKGEPSLDGRADSFVSRREIAQELIRNFESVLPGKEATAETVKASLKTDRRDHSVSSPSPTTKRSAARVETEMAVAPSSKRSETKRSWVDTATVSSGEQPPLRVQDREIKPDKSAEDTVTSPNKLASRVKQLPQGSHAHFQLEAGGDPSPEVAGQAERAEVVADLHEKLSQLPKLICPSSERKSRHYATRMWIRTTCFQSGCNTVPLI